MPRYPDPGRLDHAALEERVLAWWDEHDTFQQSLQARADAPAFVFYEGPPTANGKPGIHHVMARTIKDLFCRYKTMQGFRVDRKAGWDTHGLPVEIEVEKELGLEGRHQVEEYGIAEYNAACRESVLRYKDLWDTLTTRMGYWVDLDSPYVTFENEYVESVWNLLKRISDKGLLYQGHKIQWYSPANETVLSSHEVSLGYKEVQDPSITVRFPVEGEPDTYFLAWTTTPWTIPSNAALAVGENLDYVKVRAPREEGGSEVLIVAEALADKVVGEHEVIEHLKGRDLVGTRYAPPVSHFRDKLGTDAAWRVVAADYVTTADGTGIVHTAPAFGADDFATGQKEGLPVLNPVEPNGRFRADFPLVGGQDFKAADKAIARDLRERGLLYTHETYLHNYPHDWRKGTPLMSYPVESWFIRTTAIKDRLIELNQSINWQPEGIGTGRFGAWLEGNVDWALSRMRYWGTPLPVWVSDRDPSVVEVIGSIAELQERCGGSFPDVAINPETGTFDVHRPYVDHVTWPDGQGGTMRRVPDLIDVWFDSGAMPYAQWHYPFENQSAFERNVPADFIAEGVDQTRGWFYTLHAIAALVDDRVAYKNVVVNGLVLDAEGEKMSKSKGNAVEPFAAIDRHGVDPIRWMMMASSPPWENLRYDDREIVTVRNKLFGTVHNTYAFFATYAALDGFDHTTTEAPSLKERPELDRWILARLATTVEETAAAYDAYHPTRAARAVEAFVDDLSNWYLRRSRRRFWDKAEVQGSGLMVDGSPSGDPSTSQPSTLQPDKAAAYATLHTCLEAVAGLMAPISPFYADWLWAHLTRGGLDGDALSGTPASVHLADFPAPDPEAADEALEHRMALARAVSSVVLALRNDAGLGVRQPLARASVVVGVAGVEQAEVESVADIIRDEVNVKEVAFIPAGSGLVSKSAKPNFKALGRRLGKQMKAANAAIRALSTEQIEAYEASGSLKLDLDGTPVALEAGDLEVVSEGVEGQAVGTEAGDGFAVTVALDTALDDALRAEGLAREFVNRVQNARKAAGFEVADRIGVTFRAPDAVAEGVRAHADFVQRETLAASLEPAAPEGAEHTETVEIDGAPVTLGLRRV